MSAAVQRVIEALTAAGSTPRRRGAGWIARCPGHDDGDPSLSIREGREGRALLKCHTGCSLDQVLAALGFPKSDLFEAPPVARLRANRRDKLEPTRPHAPRPDRRPPPSNPPQGPQAGAGPIPQETSATAQPPPGCTLVAYAEAKRLPEQHLLDQGMSDCTYRKAPAVRIPYRDADGKEVAVHFRCRLGGSGPGRFAWRSGDKGRPYGLWRPELKGAAAVVLVEGESDCLTLWRHGIPALGLPGATAARDEAALTLAKVPTIYVVIEPDQGGESLRAWLATSPLRDRVRIVTLSKKDVSDLHVSDPEGFRAAWDKAVAEAISVAGVLALEAAERKRAAWEKCAYLAQAPSILDRVGDALIDMGLVGEQRAAKLLYLVATSRLFPRPLSAKVSGQSSAGKSHLVGCVLRLFPDAAYYAVTAMSDRALAYSEEPLVHRMLVLYEAAAIGGEHMPYLLRSLLSEGCVRYVTIEKTPDGMRDRLIDRPGPTGLIVTTTKLGLDPELETRLLSIPATDTPQQTANVLEALATERTSGPDLERWHAFQEWLELGDHDVEIPFARRLAKLVPPCGVRLRRDFGAVLNLIRAHAVLHQANRARDEQDRIVAVLEDYAIIRDLVVDLVSAGVQSTVPPAVRETVGAVRELAADGPGITAKAIAEHLKLDKATVSRRLQDAARLGYLRNEEERKGRAGRWVADEPMPDDLEVLPAADRLVDADTDRARREKEILEDLGGAHN
jgi:hypothetical protein